MPTINKVIVDGEEIINLDNDTLSSASQIASGITAHLNTGEQVVGTGELALYDYPIGGSYCDYVESDHTGTCTGFHISETATQIKDYAFRYRQMLQSVYVPEGVTSIGNCAFAYCKSLTSIDAPNATNVGESAFRYCYNLQSIDIHNTSNIGIYAFQDCKLLQSIDVSNATVVGESAFEGCLSLQIIDISNAANVNRCAFRYCGNLTNIKVKNGVVCVPYGPEYMKFATFNNHLYWQMGGLSNYIYISDATAGSPTRTQIGVLTTSNPSFTYTDGPYTITFARTGENNNFSISW